MTPRPALVIFDCDGVLVDSEVLGCRALTGVLRVHGLMLDELAVQRRFVGRSLDSVTALLAAEEGFVAPPDFDRSVTDATATTFRREGLLPVPGIVGALDAIAAAGLPSCVASSGPPHKIHLTLGLTGLLSRFEGRIFSAKHVPRGKPAPDLFLHAAASLGAQPAECLVVEDSLPGLQAARAAGMRAVAYAAAPWSDRPAMAALAWHLLDDMAALPEVLGL